MDFGQLVGTAWRITWRQPGLWIVGLFAGSASGSCNSSLSYSTPGTGGQDVEGFPSDFAQIFRQPEVAQALDVLQQALPILIGIFVFLFVIWLLFWLLSIACKAAVISGGGRAAAGEPSTLGVAWGEGMRAFGRLFGLELLWLLLWWVVLGLIALVAFSSLRGQPLERVNWLSVVIGLGSTFVLVGIAGSVLSVVLAFAQRAIVLDEVGTLEAVRRGLSTIRGAIGNTIILWLISAALSIGGGIVLIIALIVAAIPGLIIGGILSFIMNATGGQGIPALIGSVLLVVAVAAFVGGALLNTLLWHYWTLGYLRLTRPPVLAPAAPEIPPEALASA